MPVPMTKSTGSLAQQLPRAKAPPVMNLGPVRMSNAKRAQVGLKPNTPTAPRAKMIPQSKMPPKGYKK